MYRNTTQTVIFKEKKPMKKHHIPQLKMALYFAIISIIVGIFNNVLISCSQASKDHKIQEKPDPLAESIKEYIQKNADDPSSYQPLKSYPVDTFFNQSKSICAFEFIHSCRLKNKFGALVVTDFYVLTNPENEGL